MINRLIDRSTLFRCSSCCNQRLLIKLLSSIAPAVLLLIDPLLLLFLLLFAIDLAGHENYDESINWCCWLSLLADSCQSQQRKKRIGFPPLLRTASATTRLRHCNSRHQHWWLLLLAFLFAHSQACGIGHIVKLVGSVDLWNNFLRCSP